MMRDNIKYFVVAYPSEHAHTNMYGETVIGDYPTLDKAMDAARLYVDNGCVVSIVKDVYYTHNNEEIVLSAKYGKEVEDINIGKWVHFMKICSQMD